MDVWHGNCRFRVSGFLDWGVPAASTRDQNTACAWLKAEVWYIPDHVSSEQYASSSWTMNDYVKARGWAYDNTANWCTAKSTHENANTGWAYLYNYC